MMSALLSGYCRRAGLFLALTLFAAATISAQAPALGNLESLIAESKQAMVSDPMEAYRLARLADSRAKSLKDENAKRIALGTTRWLMGEAALRMDDEARAGPLLRSGMAMIAPIRKPIKLRGDLLLSIGGLHAAQTNAAQALSSYQQAFNIFADLGERRSQSIALQGIAALYADAIDYKNAQKYFRQAAEVYRGDPMMSLATHNNRGSALLQIPDYPEAEQELRRAMVAAKKVDSPVLTAPVVANLARALIEMRRLDEADRVVAEGLRLVQAPAARGWEPKMLAIAAHAALARGQVNRAERLIDRSFEGVDLGQTTLSYRDAHFVAYRIYKQLGENGPALRHLEALRRLTDEATKLAASTNTSLMAARFDYANQELRIANLKAEELRRSVAYERGRLRSQRILFGTLAAAAMVVLGLLSFGIVMLRRSRDRVRAANADLAATNVALEKALKAKTEFLATTSHEIRTPLNGILGMTQVMLSDPKLEPGTRDRIGIVHGAGVTMRALVDDILDVAKMETGNLTVEQAAFDLPAALREASRMWQDQAESKGLAFVLDLEQAPHWIESDPARLRQIVFNLLSNAIKFTLSGEVGLRVAAADGVRLHITVWDTGIGIPAHKHAEIFESFRQVDAGTTRQFGGTGLGLTICRNLAEALGGHISVESVADEGSRFRVDLPLVLAEPDAPAGAGAEGRLLILDRNPIARSMLKTLFEPHFAQVAFAATPDEACAAIAGQDFTQLLMDEATLKAGGDDALESLRSICAIAASHDISTALLWVRPDDNVRQDLLLAGANSVIAKPIAGAALVSAIVEAKKSDIGVNSALVSDAA